MLLAVALPVPAPAHHILGIPHYKYSEEYPQIPYLEVLAHLGRYELVFTHFPGFPEPGEAVRFKLYIHQPAGDRVFREPLQVEVVREHFLRPDEPMAEPFEIRPGTGPERNDYKFFLTFDEPEAYQLRLRFPTADGFVETVSFPVVVGKTDDRPLVFGAATVLGLAVVAVALAKKRRRWRARLRGVPA